MKKVTFMLFVLFLLLAVVPSALAQDGLGEGEPVGSPADVVVEVPAEFGYTNLVVWFGSLIVSLALVPALSSGALQGAKNAVSQVITGIIQVVNRIVPKADLPTEFEDSRFELIAIWVALIVGAYTAVTGGYSIFLSAPPELIAGISVQMQELVSAVAIIGSMQLFHATMLQSKKTSPPTPTTNPQ